MRRLALLPMEVDGGEEGTAAEGAEGAEGGAEGVDRGVLLTGQVACLDNGEGVLGWLPVRQRL